MPSCKRPPARELAGIARHVCLHPFLVSATVVDRDDDSDPWRDYKSVDAHLAGDP